MKKRMLLSASTHLTSPLWGEAAVVGESRTNAGEGLKHAAVVEDSTSLREERSSTKQSINKATVVAKETNNSLLLKTGEDTNADNFNCQAVVGEVDLITEENNSPSQPSLTKGRGNSSLGKGGCPKDRWVNKAAIVVEENNLSPRGREEFRVKGTETQKFKRGVG